MKHLKTIVLLVIGTALSSFLSEDYLYTNYTPVLLSRNDLITSISFQPARDFSQPGKLYLYQQQIYIVEKFEGVHIIDNRNPESPEKTGFIQIPGCIDIAIKDNVLFADIAVDLVSIDLKNYPDIEELGRFRDVFPEHTPPDLDYIPSRFSSRTRPSNTVIVNWEAIN
jgi:isocitrate lyase